MAAKRDYLHVTDLTRAEAYAIFGLAARLKAAPKGSHTHVLAGRAVAVILEKPSLRTRGSYAIGVAQLGGYPLSAGAEFSIDEREPIKDAARVLSRYCDAIAYRYSVAKTVADCFKYRNKIGLDVALEALTETWRGKRATADALWEAAKVDRVANVMRPYLEVVQV